MPTSDSSGPPKPEPEGFDAPSQLPQSEQQQRQWQEANRTWWENNPMRYDWKEELGCEEFSREFYDEIDRRFFAATRDFMPWNKIPFDPLIDFGKLAEQDILEIGVGSGSHAQLLASHAKSYQGIDLTDYAIRSTTGRMKLLGLDNAAVNQMDAEKMTFPDASFDLIWSWGVIHHSSNTDAILREMRRVLRPGGKATIMVYHLNFWNLYVGAGLLRGVFQGEFLKTRSVHKILQSYTDGAIARYYSKKGWTEFVSPHFDIETMKIYGQKSDMVLLPPGRIKRTILSMIPNPLGRLFTNTLGLGTFLTATMRKRD